MFAKEVSLLMQALEEEAPGCFNDLTDSVILAILEPPASSIQVIRTWMLELFVRGTVPIAGVQFKKIESLSSLLDKRQLDTSGNWRGCQIYDSLVLADGGGLT